MKLFTATFLFAMAVLLGMAWLLPAHAFGPGSDAAIYDSLGRTVHDEYRRPVHQDPYGAGSLRDPYGVPLDSSGFSDQYGAESSGPYHDSYGNSVDY